MSDAATTGKTSDDVTVISDLSIRPFEVNVPQDALDDLRRRVAAVRWPSRELVDDRTQGVQLATMEALARYWATDYDWRKVEARLNALPQFITEIDGRGHPLHPRPLEARGRAAGDRHARLAGLDHRAAQDHRAAHRSRRRTARARTTRSTW